MRSIYNIVLQLTDKRAIFFVIFFNLQMTCLQAQPKQNFQTLTFQSPPDDFDEFGKN